MEVDDRGVSIGQHQPVLRLGKIIMRDAAAAHIAEQSTGIIIPLQAVRSREVQRRPFGPGAKQAVGVDLDDFRCAANAGDRLQGTDFALRQKPGQRTRPKRRSADDAPGNAAIRPIGKIARPGL